jgi:hypothetical protein
VVLGPPQHRPRIAGHRLGQGPPHHPGMGGHAGGWRAQHRAALRDQIDGCPDAFTVPRYTAGRKSTDRHSSITNWLNSGARAFFASSGSSACYRAEFMSADARSPSRGCSARYSVDRPIFRWWAMAVTDSPRDCRARATASTSSSTAAAPALGLGSAQPVEGGAAGRIEADDGCAATRLADLLAERGDLDGATQVLRARADAGGWYAAVWLAGGADKAGPALSAGGRSGAIASVRLERGGLVFDLNRPGVFRVSGLQDS